MLAAIIVCTQMPTRRRRRRRRLRSLWNFKNEIIERAGNVDSKKSSARECCPILPKSQFDS